MFINVLVWGPGWKEITKMGERDTTRLSIPVSPLPVILHVGVSEELCLRGDSLCISNTSMDLGIHSDKLPSTGFEGSLQAGEPVWTSWWGVAEGGVSLQCC